MAEIEESLLKKKLDSYSSKYEDFQAENELTVVITLNEYRTLIVSKATKDKYTRESENEKLKKENKELEMKLFEYRKRYGELEDANEEYEEDMEED